MNPVPPPVDVATEAGGRFLSEQTSQGWSTYHAFTFFVTVDASA